MRKRILFVVIIAIILASGCQKGYDNILETEKPVAINTIKCKNGVLIFPNQQELGKTLEEINKMSKEEIEFWQAKYNFRSQLSMFNDIVLAELRLDEPYEGMTEVELQNAIPPPTHSETYYKYLGDGLIKEFTDTEGEKYYDYSTCAPYLAPILNKDGIVMVKDTMYQFSEFSIKEWMDADTDEVSTIINSTSENVKVHVISPNKGLLKSAISPNPKYSNWAYSGSNRRIKIGLYFNPWSSNSGGTVWSYQHYVHARSEKKNFWGNWKLNWTSMYILGYWSGNIEYELTASSSTAFHNFSANFHDYPTAYYVNGNNFYSSMSIETGTIYPHPATMSTSYSEIYPQLNKIVDVSLTDFYWKVTGHGDAIAVLYD